MQPLTFAHDAVNPQQVCPFFSKLPPETRELIYSFTLSPFEDPDPAAHFDENTCFKRPNYSAPWKSDIALLRTCRRIYAESWYLPWTTSQQIFYFTVSERRPDASDEGVQTVEKMQHALCILHARHGDVQLDGGVRIFAQLTGLESGRNFNRVMRMEYFLPKTVTVTIRHTDWWWWEEDDPMHIKSKWVHRARLPSSVREVRLEFESLERRKGQVDFLAEQACNRWRFLTIDGNMLTASYDACEVDRWTGSSTWEGYRWEEDEPAGRPGVLDFYVKTIIYRPLNKGDDSLFRLPPRTLRAPAVGLRGLSQMSEGEGDVDGGLAEESSSEELSDRGPSDEEDTTDESTFGIDSDEMEGEEEHEDEIDENV